MLNMDRILQKCSFLTVWLQSSVQKNLHMQKKIGPLLTKGGADAPIAPPVGTRMHANINVWSVTFFVNAFK